jgi:peptide/nickel transport system substrate-binding protein
MIERSAQFGMWLEGLFGDNMLTDRNEYTFKTNFKPEKYKQGFLAESWEWKDKLTLTVHIRQGVYWHDRPPVNGREFTADDVEYTFDRVLATGSGFTEPNAFFAPLLPSVDRVVAVDKYTIEFRLKTSSAMAIYEITGPSFLSVCMVPHEWVEMSEEDKQDWNKVTGTGPFILTDFIASTSLTMERNPDYWGYDERHPENKLPYLDGMKVVVVPDIATAIAAMRTRKIDIMANQANFISLQEAANLKETNPEIVQVKWPTGAGGVFFKYGVKPFDDINVRKAMQLAIDIPTIAESYYLGEVDGKPVGLAHPQAGTDWAIPFEEWPEELQQEYVYDPDRARQLLTEAGYPNGFSTSILASTSGDLALLQILKSNFADIGVEMEIETMDMIQQRVVVLEGKYDQMVNGGGGGSVSPPGNILGDYWSIKTEKTGGAGGVEDPVYDAMVEKFNASETEEECQKIFKEADLYVLQQHWSARLCPAVSTQLHQPWLKGWWGESLSNWWRSTYYARMWIDQDVKATTD